MKKRIWMMNHYAGNTFFELGGRHYWFARELKKQGYTPVVFCCNSKHGTAENFFDTDALWHEHNTEDGIPYVFIRSTQYTDNGAQRIKNMLLFAKNLCTTAMQYMKKQGKPDVILASSAHPFTVLVGEYIAKRLGVPCICEIRDLWPESVVAYGVAKRSSLPVRVMYSLEKYLYAKASAVIFTMEGGRDYIIEQGWDKGHGGPIDLAKIHHINNGIDVEAFDYNKIHHTFVASDLDDPSTFKVVYTGSVRLTNHVDYILEAANHVLGRGYSKIVFLIYGQGDQLKELQTSARQRGISNIYFKGAVQRKYIPFILSKADVCMTDICSSDLFRFGISPNKLFDYIASGKRIVSGLLCNYDVLDRLKCGYTLHKIDAESIADCIIDMCQMPIDDCKKHEANNLVARHQFDYKFLTKRLIKIIEEEHDE